MHHMANKTIDRKKAVPARSQAAKPSPKPASAKATRPSGTTQEKPSALKQEKSARTGAEVLEVEDVETEELVVDEDTEADEEAVDEVEEEEAVEEKPAKSRVAKAKKERDLVVSPQDYSVSRPSNSRLPNFPGSKFLYSSIRELRLVTWPSRRDTWNWSVVVVIVASAVAILLGAADLGLTQFVNWWLSLAH
jgi:preprotein translocase SecE subunit